MAISSDGIFIKTISGGIVNFGGAVHISPISITKTIAGSEEPNSRKDVIENTVTDLTRFLVEGLGNQATKTSHTRRSSSSNTR